MGVNMSKKLSFIFLVILLSIIAGCSEEKVTSEKRQDTSNQEVEKSNSAKTIKDLNQEAVNEYEGEDISYDMGHALFDFPIYAMSDTERVVDGRYFRQNLIKTDDYNQFVMIISEDDDLSENTVKTMGFYIVTGFYDDNHPLLEEIKEEYSELTYDETKDVHKVHWVSSAGTYHRFVTLKDNNSMDKDTLLANAEQFQQDYEEVLSNPQVLPDYIPNSAIEMLQDEHEDMQIGRTYVYQANDREIEHYYLKVPVGTTSQEAMELGDELYAHILALKKGHPLYDENKWEAHPFELSVDHRETEENIVRGIKKGLNEQLNWYDTIGNPMEHQNDASETVNNDDDEEIIKEQVEKIRNKSISNYTLADVQTFSMTEGKIPDIVALFHEEEIDGQSKLFVYQYDEGSKQWKQSIERDFHMHYDVLTTGDPFNGGNEQVAIGGYSGSAGYLQFVVIGSPDGHNVSILLDQSDGDYSGSPTVVFRYEAVEVQFTRTAEDVASFKWNGENYE